MAGNPIVEFYIQNYMWNNSLVSTETKFQEVPFSGDPVILEPRVKNELGKAGSFEFKMESISPYYNALLQMKTLMRVTYFGTTIFRGRVLTIDKTMYGTRTVHCEGDFAFLLDSHQIGTKEDTRPEISVLQFLQQIIAQHNSDVSGDSYKQFTLGEVPGQYTNATNTAQRVVIPSEKANQKFGDTAWNSSMDRIESLLSTFGGYFRTRFVKGTGGAADVTYLDWYDKYYNASTNTQTIEISKNLIDLSGPTEVENLFTIVVPIGRDTNGENVYISDYWPIVQDNHAKVNYITVPELATIPLYTDAELNSDYHRKTDYQNAITRFGKIWKPVDFENANTPEKLFAYAKDWIKNNFMPELTQWSVNAIDMKVVNPANQVLLCGDRATLTHPEVDTTYSGMTIISTDYDLYNPDKDKFVIGIPSQQINAAYGVKVKENKNTGSKGGGGGGISGGAGGRNKNKEEVEDDIERMRNLLQQQYILKTDYNQDILLDNPTAYLIYNTDGTEKTKQEAMSSVVTFMNKVNTVKRTQRAEILQEAIIRGVSPDDYQLLIDFIPAEKQKQTWFKATSSAYFTNTVGLSLQEANVILNETAGESFLASLVDDNGNWTDYAISKGATIWDPSLKQTAIKVRKILQGTETTQNGGMLSSFQETLSGLGINLDNYLSFDYGDRTFNLGEIINTFEVPDSISGLVTKGVSFLTNLISGTSEEKNKTSGSGTWYEKALNVIGGIFTGNNTESGGKQFNLQSDNTQVDGVNAGIGLGNGGYYSGWQVALNKTFTYTANGHSYTVPAHSLAADDVHFTAKYDSLRAKLLVVDNLLADYAQIGTLVAMQAQIDTIDANYITASYINATNITAALVGASLTNVHSLTARDSIGCTGPISGTEIWSGGVQLNVRNVSKSNDGKTLYIYTQNDGTISFEKGDTDAAYKNGWNDCISACTPHGARWSYESYSGDLFYYDGEDYYYWSRSGGFKGGYYGTLYEIPSPL